MPLRVIGYYVAYATIRPALLLAKRGLEVSYETIRRWVLEQRRRNKAAAIKLMRKLLKKQGVAPKVLMTDKLESYGAARSELGLSTRHEQRLRRDDEAENSH
ncbi:DDE domain-containing protein [Rhizobiales bacterium GAS113]|nr:DDE domain-containing protein [Rhizobiales bacterium GAS113]